MHSILSDMSIWTYMYIVCWKTSTQCPKGQPCCKRMDDTFLSSCKAALSNLLSSDRIRQSDDPFTAFSSAIRNFYSHYCLNEHGSEWCHHDKVCNIFQMKHIIFCVCFNVYRRLMVSPTRPNTDLPVRHRLRSSVTIWRVWLHIPKTTSRLVAAWRPTQLRGFMD